jgi:hypothetical protein
MPPRCSEKRVILAAFPGWWPSPMRPASVPRSGPARLAAGRAPARSGKPSRNSERWRRDSASRFCSGATATSPWPLRGDGLAPGQHGGIGIAGAHHTNVRPHAHAQRPVQLQGPPASRDRIPPRVRSAWHDRAASEPVRSGIDRATGSSILPVQKLEHIARVALDSPSGCCMPSPISHHDLAWCYALWSRAQCGIMGRCHAAACGMPLVFDRPPPVSPPAPSFAETTPKPWSPNTRNHIEFSVLASVILLGSTSYPLPLTMHASPV